MLHSLRWESTRLLIEWPWVRGLHFIPVRAGRGPLDHSTPWGSLWLLSLKVRTPVSQAGNDGFKPHRSYCGYRTMVVRQIVALLMGVRFPLVTPWMGMPSGEGSGL